MIVRYHDLLKSIISNQDFLFIPKFWSLLCNFFNIQQKLSIKFYLLIKGQTKRQNSLIGVYLHIFVNWEQNNQIKLLSMTEFVYNNTKIINISHISFELNYNYYFYIFFDNKINSCLKSYLANNLVRELIDLISKYQQIYSIYNNYKGKLIRKILSFVTMYQVRKFGAIANTSK